MTPSGKELVKDDLRDASVVESLVGETPPTGVLAGVLGRQRPRLDGKRMFRSGAKVALWCVLFVWPAYLLEIAVAAGFKGGVTHPFAAATRLWVVGLPIVALAGAVFGLLVMGISALFAGAVAQTVSVLIVASVFQLGLHAAGGSVLPVRILPVGLGFLALVGMSLFELGRTREPLAVSG